VHYAQHQNITSYNAIDRDVGGFLDDEFSCSGQQPRPADVWKVLEHIYLMLDAIINSDGGLRAVVPDVIENRFAIEDRL
jgi:hypothetical protein